jgi:hypothetical protein
MRISYNCYFIQPSYGIDIKVFISHTKRINFCIVFIKFIDKLLVLTRNNHRRRCFFKNSCEDLASSKKNAQCD